MYAQSARFRKMKRLLAFLVILPILGGVALVLLGIDIGMELGWGAGLWPIAAGTAVVLSNLLVWLVGYTLLKIDSSTSRSAVNMYDLYEELQKHTSRLDNIVENVRLSDAARSLAHREEEYNALRAAIQGDITQRDWEGALALVSEMERRFGSREEVQRMREQLRRDQSACYRGEVERAVPFVESLFDAHDWDRADQEITRLINAFPHEPRFAQLREEMARRRLARKQELVRAFTSAVEREDIDIDTGMQVLQELDKYLTREEAKQLEEAARKVVKGKLEQLGVRFRFAVTEERWRDALEVGVSIIEEFPNSRIAQEVRERLNILRERAGLSGDVEVTSGPESAATPTE